MENAYNKNSVQCKNRKHWQDEHKGEKRTCRDCGKTAFVYDESELDQGFGINPNTYKGVKKLSPALVCLSCKAVARKAKKVGAKAAEEIITGKRKGIFPNSEKQIEKSWMCRKCDVINSGKRRVCRVCGKATYRWNGIKSNHEKQRIDKPLRAWKRGK